jgi:hypothetical protein
MNFVECYSMEEDTTIYTDIGSMTSSSSNLCFVNKKILFEDKK